MKRAFLYILVLTAAVLVSWGIWKNDHDSKMAEEREKFQDAREQFVKMEEQYVPGELSDLDYFRSAEVSVEDTLKPTQYDEDDLIWVEKVTVTVSVVNWFDALKEQQKFDYIEQVRAASVNAITKIQKDKVPEYAAYRTYRKNAFPGYEKQTVSYVGNQYFYVKTDVHTYEYTDFYVGAPGISQDEKFYKMDGDLVKVEDEDDGGSDYDDDDTYDSEEDEDLTDESAESTPDTVEDTEEANSSFKSPERSFGGITVKRGASRRPTQRSLEKSGNSTGRSSGSSERSSGITDRSADKEDDEPDTYEDEYNVNDYDDPEDFYEDNADDFEDEEDAEDYYDEYHE